MQEKFHKCGRARFDCHILALVKRLLNYLFKGVTQALFKTPLHLASGPLGFWYCKIDSLNQTLIDIPKIGMRANEPKKL